MNNSQSKKDAKSGKQELCESSLEQVQGGKSALGDLAKEVIEDITTGVLWDGIMTGYEAITGQYKSKPKVNDKEIFDNSAVNTRSHTNTYGNVTVVESGKTRRIIER